MLWDIREERRKRKHDSHSRTKIQHGKFRYTAVTTWVHNTSSEGTLGSDDSSVSTMGLTHHTFLLLQRSSYCFSREH